MENISKGLFHNIALQSKKVKSVILLKGILNHGFIIVLFNGAMMAPGHLLSVSDGVDRPVVDDGGGRVGDLDGLLGAIFIGAVDFLCFSVSQCQGPLGACAGLVPVSLTKGLTGLAGCNITVHPNLHPPQPQPLTRPLYIVTDWCSSVAPLYQIFLPFLLVLFRLEAKTNSVRPKSPIERTILYNRRLNTRTKTMTKVWMNSKRTNQSNQTE